MRGASVVALMVSSLVAGCSTTISPTEETGGTANSYRLTVRVTNVGNGFGRVAVEFPVGRTEQPCTAILGPAGLCEPSVIGPEPTPEAEIQVAAEPGSRFVGWSGASCAGTSTECTVVNRSRETDAVIAVEARFELESGGS